MPHRKLGSYACPKITHALTKHATHGWLCQDCTLIAINLDTLLKQKESLTTSGTSNMSRSGIANQLRRLTRKLLERNRDRSAGKKSIQQNHEEVQLYNRSR